MEKFEKALRRARKDQAGQIPMVETTHRFAAASPNVDAVNAGDGAAVVPPPIARAPATKHHEILDLVALDYANPSADLFRILRTQVLKALSRLEARTLGVCSAQAGEGKTYVAANLASSIALSQEWSALLVDLDLRRPGAHRHLGMASSPGITDFLGRTASLSDCVRPTKIPGLELLSAGAAIRNSSEALGSSRLQDAFSGLTKAASSRIIVCDLPPLLASDDALLFSAKLGAVILVVEEGRTTPTEVQRSLELLTSTQIIGTVLNKSKSKGTLYYSTYNSVGA